MKVVVSALLLTFWSLGHALAQEIAGDSLASGALRNPEDEGLPWTYIVLVAILLGLFLLLRRNRTLPSKRRERP